MAEAIDLAIVGCGAIAEAYLEALEGLAGLRLTAVVETSVRRLSEFRCASLVRRCASLDQLLDHAHPPAAALVLTPPASHEPLALALLDAGLHVFCEKPLALSSASAERMCSAAARASRRLMMGSKFRYTPDLLTAHSLLAEGLIGEALLFENVFCSRVEMATRWNSRPEISGGGVLIDNGSHSVDIARWLLGPLARVQAQFARRVQPVEVEDTARLLFETHSGTVGSIDLSWSLHKEVPSFVRLYGERGTIEVGWRRSRHKVRGEREWTAFGRGYDKVEAFRNQLADFAASILDGQTPRITDLDALASVRAVEAAYRSAAERRWVDLAAEAEIRP
ncbi:MAG: Gfo/Idh/MocA family oxidoreductase [Planctomycetota bacterium]